MTERRIAVGADVCWSSSANGTWLWKRGRVLGFVPADADAWRDLPPGARLRNGIRWSLKPRYLVAVTHEGPSRHDVVAYGPTTRKARYYTPYASIVERENPAALGAGAREA